MRKTKNLPTTFKALLLIFALCALCTIQSNAQSNRTQSVDITPQEILWNVERAAWDFSEWLKTIVTLDMSLRPDEQKPDQSQNNKGTFNGGTGDVIVTPDMTIRDPD